MTWWGQPIDQMTPDERARLRSTALGGGIQGAVQAAGSRDFAMAAPAQALAMILGGGMQGARQGTNEMIGRDIQGAQLHHMQTMDTLSEQQAQLEQFKTAQAMRQQEALNKGIDAYGQQHPEAKDQLALLRYLDPSKAADMISGGSRMEKATIAHMGATEDLSRQQLAATMANEQAARALQQATLANTAGYQKAQLGLEGKRLGIEAQGQERQLAALQQSQKQQGFTQANQLRDQFNTLTKDVRDAPTNFQKIKSGFEMGTGGGDIAGLTAYMKMLDPTSVVREGEFATAANAGGVSEWIRNLYNKAKSGTILAPDVRKQLLDAAGGQVKAYKGKYDSLTRNYTDFATRAGLDPKDVINPVEFPDLAAPPAAPAGGGVQTVPNPVAPDYSAFGF